MGMREGLNRRSFGERVSVVVVRVMSKLDTPHTFAAGRAKRCVGFNAWAGYEMCTVTVITYEY
jgi:hypothetical protein